MTTPRHRRKPRNDPAAQAAPSQTNPLKEIDPADFDAVFYPGGHGPLWDLAEDPHSIALIEAMVAGRKVTGFTNSEEEAVGLTTVVPFLVKDMLTAQGGMFSRAADWQPYAVSDGLLITGQNPASSDPVAAALLDQLG